QTRGHDQMSKSITKMQYPKNEKQSNQEEPLVDEYRMHKDLSSFKQEEPNQSIYCLTKPEINSQNLRLGPKNCTLLLARP
ncbi:hypothetical protein GBA52_012256, partial [Prunus armeniaca]